MGRSYKNPPLIEALCEFRFEPGQPWDWTVPGLVYAKLGEQFPKKREQKSFELALREGPKETRHTVRQELARMQFVREDDSALVQVGPDILAVNLLRPYPTWPTFKEHIARVLDIYRAVASPKGFSRIGLRYINRLEIPERQRFTIEDYLTAIPTIPEALPQTFFGWLQRTDLLFEDIGAVLSLQTGSRLDREDPEAAIFMLDLDCGTLHPDTIALDDAMEWVEKAHEKVEEAFEASITDKSRALFEEVNHAAERARA